MNKLSTSLVALLAVFGTADMALSITTSAFEASVSVLSPDATGFNLIGQTQVNGLGSSSVVLSRAAAELSVTGGASSTLDNNIYNYVTGVTSDSFINSGLNFEREVTTAGSLVGQGNVIASGTAIGSIGTAGAASATTSTGGTDATAGEGSATADASAQGSLNGAVSTVNSLQLLGTNGLFAGSNGLSVGEQNVANAYGQSTIVADGVSGIDLNGASLTAVGSLGMMEGTGDGALFAVTSDLTSTLVNSSTAGIELSVSNAGNGTISLATSTGGFFTGGGFAGGAATFADTGTFFSQV